MTPDEAQKITPRDLRALRTELILRMARHSMAADDANPEVGPGLSFKMAVNDALKEKGWTRADVDLP